jgi:predicted nucleotidyltransferase
VARGDDSEDSDINILIITKNIDDDLKIDDVYDKVFDILLNTGENLSVKMRTKDQYQKYNDFPFYMNINKEGILIG